MLWSILATQANGTADATCVDTHTLDGRELGLRLWGHTTSHLLTEGQGKRGGR